MQGVHFWLNTFLDIRKFSAMTLMLDNKKNRKGGRNPEGQQCRTRGMAACGNLLQHVEW